MSNYVRFFVKPILCTVVTIALMSLCGIDTDITFGMLLLFHILSLGFEYVWFKLVEENGSRKRNNRKCKSF